MVSPDPDCRHCLGRGWCPSLDVHPREYACGCSAPVCIGCGATVPREGDECGRCDGYDDRPATPMERAWLAWVTTEEVCS